VKGSSARNFACGAFHIIQSFNRKEQLYSSIKPSMKTLVRYFLQGLLFLVPFTITIYVVVSTITWLDNLVSRYIPNFDFPGIGILALIIALFVIGFLASTILVKPLFDLFDRTLRSIPLVSIVYTALKDLVSAFVGDKKKFDQPVLVNIYSGGAMKKLGFITSEDLSSLNLEGMVAVYLPHSYQISGNMFVVDRDQVSPIELPGSEVMKFIISGGVTNI